MVNGVIGIVFIRVPLKFLLVHNYRSGNKAFPAGGREEDETVEEALQREIKEETGLLQHEYKIITTPLVNKFVYNRKKAERFGQETIQEVFLVETERKELDSKDSNNRVEGWFTKEEMLKHLTFDEHKDILNKVIEYIYS